MTSLTDLRTALEEYLKSYPFSEEPRNLYDPVRYILDLKAKRLRPLMAIAAYELYADNVQYAFDAALAVEVFHNFSLLHDDIMDDADTRRGHEAVHIKYDENTAILSGDAMMIMSYQFFEKYPAHFKELVTNFSKTALEVCEGQRMDMDFEVSDEVTIEAYLKMIELKTSVLVAEALRIGGVLGNATEADKEHLYQFGKNTGVAFQIQDDLLDTFGDASKVGKKIGGDIAQKKKTYLYLKSLELLDKESADRLRKIYQQEQLSEEDVQEVISLKKKAHVNVHAEELKLVYHQLALSHLNAVSVDDSKKKVLKDFASDILNREL